MRPAVLAAVLVLAGCQSERVEEVRSALIGLDARTLQRCLGEPRDMQIETEVEYITYFWELFFDEKGMRVLDPQERREALSPLSRIHATLGYCQIVFEIRDRRISQVEARGQNGAGSRWNSGCLLRAKRCLPRDALR